MKISHIISASLISMAAYGCQEQPGLRRLKSEGGIPSILQQRDIKGLHAGHQVMAMGLFQQAMRSPSFRSYAQQRFQSDVQEGVQYLLGHTRDPECLSEDGEIPESSLIREGVTGPCSLYFYKGRFNVKRYKNIKRIPPCDIDPELRQLDDKTIKNYLSVAHILMKRCNDDSIVLRSHVGGNGGAWQVIAYEALMSLMGNAGRLLTQFTIVQAVRSVSETAQREVPQLAQRMANRVADAIPGAVRTGVLYAGEATYHTIVPSPEGSVHYALAVMRDGVEYIVENAPRTLSTRLAETIRELPQNPTLQLGQRVGAAAIAGAVYDVAMESITSNAPSTFIAGAIDVLSDTSPQTAREGAAAWILSWTSGLWNFALTWRF